MCFCCKGIPPKIKSPPKTTLVLWASNEVGIKQTQTKSIKVMVSWDTPPKTNEYPLKTPMVGSNDSFPLKKWSRSWVDFPPSFSGYIDLSKKNLQDFGLESFFHFSSDEPSWSLGIFGIGKPWRSFDSKDPERQVSIFRPPKKFEKKNKWVSLWIQS